MNFSRTLLVLIAVVISFGNDQLHAFQRTAEAVSVELPETDEGLPGAGPIRRYDWFRNLWKSRRGQWAKTQAEDQNAVVFLGDSITQGWGDKLHKSFGEMKVANRGISGDTTRGMLIRLEEDVLSLNPTGVVMLMGTNDLEEGADPKTVASNIQLILEAIHAHQSEMPIIISLVFPSSETKKRPSNKIQELNQLIREAARNFEHVTVLDTWTLFANSEGDAKVEEFPDLLHPNELGYEKWRMALIPLLETNGLLDVPEDDFELEAGFESLFNGQDLTGWGFLPTPPANPNRKRNPNAPHRPEVAEAVSFDGLTESSDGRYVAKDGRLIVTTPMEGRRIQQLWSHKSFPNDFTLKLEFRATPNADSGVFIRQPQLQCRDYLLAGPYNSLQKYRPQDWNELVVEVKGNVARCTCNGEVLEEAFELPATGPVGLEGDRGQIEYRRIRIKHAGGN
ncbi:GDSL-type esterase/lipase family protein [Thalassoglobus sp. JC818]|uniref:GDSL-type esterase/lipase family protein n=1 Tax=Thalassoglobus sp. JC818 TaxID=3232136 RepID=UPI00345932BD